ncbi:MAG TPA: hypothetical protein VK208_10985 [Pyrinomonadaceae bacterium]|nr:hypothetical protein [Pyrinomonadaceae bacterium]
MSSHQNSFITIQRIILVAFAIAFTVHTANAQKAPAEATKLVLHAPQAVINPSGTPTVLASVDITAYREIRVSARGPVGKGILIGVYQVEGETAILLDKILLENTSLSPDPQVPDLLFGTTNRATKVIDFPGRNLRITGVAINLLDGTVSGATVDLIIYGR